MTVNLNLVFHPEAQAFVSKAPMKKSHKCLDSIKTIKDQLKESPFVVFAKIGTEVYSDAPFKLNDKVAGQDIFGWSPNATRKDGCQSKCFLVLGAQERDGKEVVYYAPAQFVVNGPRAASVFQRSSADQKIYVASMKRFKEATTNLILPEGTFNNTFPSSDNQTSKVKSEGTSFGGLSVEEKEWAEKFAAFTDILGSQEKECKSLAQEMFNEFKKTMGSVGAKKAMVRVCESLHSKPYLERAWNLVGDNEVTWMA